MRRETFMIVAGEPSGDALGAELAKALKQRVPEADFRLSDDVQPLTASLVPEFFGAGGQRMVEAGVELIADMTEYSAVGLSDVVRNYPRYRRVFHQLLNLAIQRCPDVVVLVDFSKFNHALARAIRSHVASRRGGFFNWHPKIVQLVSPQVWASRPGRARRMERDLDLLLALFPFEKEWYREHAPKLRVEFVGHPMMDRHLDYVPGCAPGGVGEGSPLVLLLPGSRPGELRRHLPPILGAAQQIAATRPARLRMILPTDGLLAQAWAFDTVSVPNLEMRVGGLSESLAQAHLAIASTGTVTLECAYFGVPTVAIYKTSWSTYEVGKRIARVNYMALPNLLANEPLYPELIQEAANADAIAREALELLDDDERRKKLRSGLATVIDTLGGPGAGERAARAIVNVMHPEGVSAQELPAEAENPWPYGR